MTSKTLSRRTALLGSAGAVVGLPWLEAMVGRGGKALAQVTPRRYLLAFAGVTPGRENLYLPSKEGPGYDLKRTLAPLANVSGEVTVVTGLLLPPTGPGSWGGGSRFHGSTNGPILSGVSNPDNGNATPRGPTSDQVVADTIDTSTRFRSLEYRVQARNYRESARGGIISMRRTATGTLQPNEPQASPLQAYNALFTGFAPPGGAPMQDPAAQIALMRDRSIIDRVSRRAATLMKKLGEADRKRMERHYDEIRALETRLTSTFKATAAGCGALPPPGPDPETTTDVYLNGTRPVGYSGENERVKLLNALLRMAFTCDMTRVATLLYTYAQCCMNAQPLLNFPKVTDLHEIGHGAGTAEQTADTAAWHVRQFAELVAQLRDTPEGNGSVLDNCALVLMFEGGFDGVEPHSGKNMMALVAGGAGGLKRGHHVRAVDKHPVNVLLSAMQAVGSTADKLGEIEGRIPELFV